MSDLTDTYGPYWDVPVCSYVDNPEPKYTVWLLKNLGFAGPRKWEWEENYYGHRTNKMYAVRFRSEEDALAFKLTFGL